MHIIRAYHSQRDFLTFDFDLDLFFCFFSCSFMDEITIERALAAAGCVATKVSSR